MSRGKPSSLTSKAINGAFNVLGFCTYHVIRPTNATIQRIKHLSNRIQGYEDIFINTTIFPYYTRTGKRINGKGKKK